MKQKTLLTGEQKRELRRVLANCVHFAQAEIQECRFPARVEKLEELNRDAQHWIAVLDAWTCEACGKPLPDYKPEYCCDGRDCGCYGLPIHPPVCNEECFEQMVSNRFNSDLDIPQQESDNGDMLSVLGERDLHN